MPVYVCLLIVNMTEILFPTETMTEYSGKTDLETDTEHSHGE